MPLRLPYLGITNAFALLRLLPGSGRDKDAEILALRHLEENPSWGSRRVHGELLTLGVTGAASTVREILRSAGIDPAPDRVATTWAQFLRRPTRWWRRTSSRPSR